MMNKVKRALTTPAAKIIFASMFILIVLITYAVLRYKANVRKRKRAKAAKKTERVVYRDDD
jgi:DMSO/TMAO reductase YedYZ heme-binding membrane subunit